MGTVQDIWKNPLTAQLHQKKRQLLRDTFPMLRNCSHKSYLSLSKYLDGTPERFYSQVSFDQYCHFLSNEQQVHASQLTSLLNSKRHEIDRALLFLNELNRDHWHDSLADFDDYELTHFLDTTTNPTYLKLIESVYFHFIFLVAASSRLNRGRSLDGLDVYNCVDEINRTQFSPLSRPYDNVVRNGIAHGGITYREKETIYRDKKGNTRKLRNRAVIALVDDLLDICNAFTLAIKLFFISNLNPNINILRQLMIEELQAETDAPWWHIEGCLVSEVATQSQLIVYARPNTRDYFKVQHATFLSAALCEQFAPGFDRYFFSLRSPVALPGWAAFDGKKLQQVREKGPESMEDYKGVLENDLIFFLPRLKPPRFLCRWETYLHSFRLHLPLAMAEFRRQLNLTPITVRHVTIHRNGYRSVLNGSVVLQCSNDAKIRDVVRRSCRRVITKALIIARKEAKLTNTGKFLPLGYARLSIFKKDFRRRKLSNYGLGAEVVCTIQIKRIVRIKVPDIFGSTIETRGRYRIAWNKSWLESLAKQE